MVPVIAENYRGHCWTEVKNRSNQGYTLLSCKYLHVAPSESVMGRQKSYCVSIFIATLWQNLIIMALEYPEI